MLQWLGYAMSSGGRDGWQAEDVLMWALATDEYIIATKLINNCYINPDDKKIFEILKTEWIAAWYGNDTSDTTSVRKTIIALLIIILIIKRTQSGICKRLITDSACKNLCLAANSVLKKGTPLGNLYRELQNTIRHNDLPNIDSLIDCLYFSCPEKMFIIKANCRATRLLAIITAPLITLGWYFILAIAWSLFFVIFAVVVFILNILHTFRFGFYSISHESYVDFSYINIFDGSRCIARDIACHTTKRLVEMFMGNGICLNNPFDNIRALDCLFIFPLLFIVSDWVLSHKMPWYHPLRVVSELVRALLFIPYGLLRTLEFLIIKLIVIGLVLLTMPAILSYKAAVTISGYNGPSFFKIESTATERDELFIIHFGVRRQGGADHRA